MAQYKLIHKSDVFLLTSHSSRNIDTRYYVSVSVSAKEHITQPQRDSIRSLFSTSMATPHKQTALCWVFTDEDSAKAVYNWANIQWPHL